MKAIFIGIAVFSALSSVRCSASAEEETIINKKADVYTVTKNIRFNEGTLPLRNRGILLSNFGTETLDPLNKEGRGYIVLLEKGNKILFPASGALNAPKGMATNSGSLFIADVGCVMVYNLKKTEVRPLKITFPDGELFVNDVLSLGDFLLVSVTNTGHLFTIDIKDFDAVWSGQRPRPRPKQVADIPGANGLAEHEGTLYVASYDPNENPGEQNVIYAIDITAPNSKPVNLLGTRYGQYDGVAVSPDGTKLYFSNWRNAKGKAEVGYIDLTPGKKNAVTILDPGVELQGPADISISDGYLYIPDLPANKLYIMAL